MARLLAISVLLLALPACLRIQYDRCEETPPHPDCLDAGRDGGPIDAPGGPDASGADASGADDAGGGDAGESDAGADAGAGDAGAPDAGDGDGG